MTNRITLSNVHGAFKRLHTAMGWPGIHGSGIPLPHYSKMANGRIRANIGAVALCESGYGFEIQIIDNENGGVTCPFMGWRTKREAWDSMIAMAQAVELYKQGRNDRHHAAYEEYDRRRKAQPLTI